MADFWENFCPGHKVDFKHNLNFNSLVSEILYTDNYIYMKKTERYIRVFEMNWVVYYTFLYYEHMKPFFSFGSSLMYFKKTKT